MSRRSLALEGTLYPTQTEWFAALAEELRVLDRDGAYYADDLIRDVIRACRWMPDDWVDRVERYAMRSSDTDERYPDRNPETPILWIRLDDGAKINVGWKSITATRQKALGDWLRDAIEPQIEAEREIVRAAGGYTCAYGGERWRGTQRLQIDHRDEFMTVLVPTFLAEFTGLAGATADDVEFAHPNDEATIKSAFIPWHRERAVLQPMCKPHNQQKERERKRASALSL